MAEDASSLTKRQKQVLRRLEKDESPSAIAKALGISVNGVYQHRRRLTERGFLTANDRPGSAGRSRVGQPRRSGRRKTVKMHNGRMGVLSVASKTLHEQQDAIAKALEDNAAERASIDAEMMRLTEKRDGLKVEQDSLVQGEAAVGAAVETLPA